MRLYLLSLLTIGYVQSLTITYPYRPLLAYDPLRTQIADKPTTAQGFLVYLDNGGIERIVAYNYAEPVYAIRRISYINSGTPAVQTLMTDEITDDIKAREAHFRVWSLHQYQILKREIDLLKEEGKEPSIEMKLKFLPLEKIALTPDFTTIADSPEIQRVRKEHLNIWKQIEQSNQNQIKGDITQNDTGKLNTSSIALEDTLMHKQNNDQKPLNNKNNIMLLLTGDKSVIDQLNATKILNDLKDVKPELIFASKIDTETDASKTFEANDTKLKSDDEIKLQAEEKNVSLIIPEAGENFEESKKQIRKSNLKSNISSIHQTAETLQTQQISDIPKIVQESEDKIETSKNDEKQDKILYEPEAKMSTSLEQIKKLEQQPLLTNSHSNASELKPKEIINISETVTPPEELKNKLESSPEKIKSTISTTEKEQQNLTKENQISEKNLNNNINETFVEVSPLKDVLNISKIVNTPEKPLNLVTEEKSKSNTQKKVHSEVEKLIATAPKIYVPQQVVDTDEVMRARNEHLRIVNEALQKAKLAQAQEQQPEVTTELTVNVSNKKDEENGDKIQENNMD